MASTTRTTNGTSLNASSIRSTYTTPLRAQIQSGNTIRASHLNSLRDFVSLIRNHTHTLVEFSDVGTYSGNTSHNRTTSIVKIGSSIPGNLNVASRNSGTIIDDSHHKVLRDAVNGVRSHKHEFTDS